MEHYYEHPERFPAELRQILLPEGTVIHGEYRILAPLYAGGTELCYHAQQIPTGIDCLLFALIPVRWCRTDAQCRFVPYHDEAAEQWERFRKLAISRLAALQKFAQEAAVPAVKDGFEDMGTIWYVTRYEDVPSLASVMAEKQFSPKEAVSLMAPLLDTLSGMHEAGLYHGAVTAGAIRLVGDGCQLRGWLSLDSLSPPNADDDLRAVSLVLWQMMTGTDYYAEEAASRLPGSVRAALYNGMFDRNMTVGKLWKQLHTKHPAKRVQTDIMQPTKRSFLSRIFTPVVTAVFCACCVAAPVLYWRLADGTLVSETAAETLDDVVYSLADDEMQMPELLYTEQEDAVAQLEAMGLQVILASREDNPVVPENQIVTQNPNAGAIVRAGDTVTLGVSDGWANYVPDVCGMTKEQAQQKLTDLGFVVEFREKISPDDAPGSVIAQSVRADTKLERDSTIRLTVSLGREDLDVTKLETIGDYVGIDFETAKAELTEMHLYAAQIETVYDPEIPAGVIISQDIEPGKQVAQGTVLNMTVSKGVETARVPGVLHLTANSARELLTSAKLCCVICYVSNNEWAMDTVLSQNVAEGELVPVGTEVWLEVSVGSGSYVESTGGWSGAPLPTFESTETDESEEESEEDGTYETDDSSWETDAPETYEPETDAPYVPETDPETDAPDLSTEEEEEMTAPPMPVG